MPYRLSFENAVRGIRFQPIYSVAEKAIKASGDIKFIAARD